MKTDTPGITRFEYGSTRGYVVRYTCEKALFPRLFSDGKWGSKEAAYEAAKMYLAELKNAFPPMNRREYAEIKKRTNSSGRTGVHRRKEVTRGRWTYEYWVATWSPTVGKPQSKKFSINKLGEEKAYQLAVEAREAGLREMELDWPERKRQLDDKRSSSGDGQIQDTPVIRNVQASEGELKCRIYLERSRNKTLREAVIENYRALNNDVRCQVCDFSFEDKYGVMGKGLIEVHHIVPLSTFESETVNSVDDLILLCANCHYVVHNGDAQENLRRLKILFSGERFVDKRRPSNNAMHPTRN